MTEFRVRVTMTDGKLVKRELMANDQKIGEFRNSSEYLDFVMQVISALRYDHDKAD